MPDASSMFDKLAQKREKVKSAPDPVPETEPKKRQRKATGKRSDPNYIQVGAYIPIELNKSVKRRLVDTDQDFSELVAELLAQWVQSNND
ncbi:MULTISPECIES: hypothetical protein [Cyanophyceae]|uniref:hypothetical protein n=1 Tax=Cyanophyceae TaxID=3028117 RepID=UPI0016855777|nr:MULTISPECIES: hypothetical protein [Cyanophyceae]MBD1914440.1 hypothetical protein [Phormidium sp. FACHB-77]MBD2028849.1 hypothetical protein [Phormidium sp. FACHB-322]MBD2049213.1 hypothetical protein [Leptolyngbya sp. FACHB-60]